MSGIASSTLSRAVSMPLRHAATRNSASSLTTRRLMSSAQAIPAQTSMGPFRGSVFGFLTGSSAAAATFYYLFLDEYRLTNEALREDIYALQAATQRLGTYITELEGQVDRLQKKK